MVVLEGILVKPLYSVFFMQVGGLPVSVGLKYSYGTRRLACLPSLPGLWVVQWMAGMQVEGKEGRRGDPQAAGR